jgi:uncharacterized protein (TIGR00369 family)
MDLKGSRTEQNLEKAFTVGSKARNFYTYSAEIARKAGYPFIADAFIEIAQNENEHARRQLEFLKRIQDTATNLETAAQGEQNVATSVYPEYAQTAREEGFTEVADYFERMTRVEARHEAIIRNLQSRLREQTVPKERTIGHSAMTFVQIMYPHQGNWAGNVHGGEIMKLMDTVAGVVAHRHAHTNVVTVKVEELNFLKPVLIGDLVFAHAKLVFVSRSSMEVRVEVETESLATEERQTALTASFIYVSLDNAGNPTEVPPLLITTEEGEKLFEEGRRRYELRKQKTKPA